MGISAPISRWLAAKTNPAQSRRTTPRDDTDITYHLSSMWMIVIRRCSAQTRRQALVESTVRARAIFNHGVHAEMGVVVVLTSVVTCLVGLWLAVPVFESKFPMERCLSMIGRTSSTVHSW